MVVDPEVDEDVGEVRVPSVALDDEEGRGLAPAAVAARRLRRVEAVEQPLREPLPGRRLERLGERVDRLARHEDVPLRGVAGAGAAARPGVALVARVGRRPALGIDDPELAVGAALVRRGEPLDHLLGAEPVAQEREPSRAVAGIRVRLRRDRADVRLRPRDDRADREELRLRRHAPLPRLEVARADRVRRDRGGDAVADCNLRCQPYVSSGRSRSSSAGSVTTTQATSGRPSAAVTPAASSRTSDDGPARGVRGPQASRRRRPSRPRARRRGRSSPPGRWPEPSGPSRRTSAPSRRGGYWSRVPRGTGQAVGGVEATTKEALDETTAARVGARRPACSPPPRPLVASRPSS